MVPAELLDTICGKAVEKSYAIGASWCCGISESGSSSIIASPSVTPASPVDM